MKKLLTLSPELVAAIDHARREKPFSGYVELLLWRSKEIRDAAKSNEIRNPKRPLDRRGGSRKPNASNR